MKKTVTFCIEEELLGKLRKIAEQEYRSLSKQIEIAVREYVTAYEQKD